jgi:predicted GIY-YIG superfamily endonuclease
MNIHELVPQPPQHETFKRSRLSHIPDKPGCYVLTTFAKVVLYVGLTQNLRRRMNEHLDNPQKTCQTKNGRPVLFFWIESEEVNKVERTWMNIHIQHEGRIPELNKIYSPTSV